jgi:hypothetical protein
MRLRQLALAAVLAGLSMHCSSEDKAPDDGGVVEGRAGTLVITTPERAAFIADDTDEIEVHGKGATKALTINGTPAEVDADGSFHATVKPQVGLNLVVAVDGESRLETPYLYGHFKSAKQPVPRAISLDVGAIAIAAPAPTASLTSVTNLALEGRNLVELLKGQSFSGDTSGVTFKFDVKDGSTGSAKVRLDPAAGGVGANASVPNLVIDGRLSITSFGVSYARDVRIQAKNASVEGDVKLGVDEAKGAFTAAMPNAKAELEGFSFDTDDAGFPCCVDTILSVILKSKLEQAIGDGLRQEIPKIVQLTLHGMGVPKEIDLAAAKISAKVPVTTQFDSGAFDTSGGTLTAATLFGGEYPPGSVGAEAPGWLAFGKPYVPSPRATALGVSFSLDALNQFMFAVWGTGSASLDVPAPLDAKLTPGLPPVITITETGALRIGLGEIRVQRGASPTPMAAVTVIQDVAARGDGDALLLASKGESTVSITWLTDDVGASGKNLIAVAAKEQLAKFLTSFRIPLPKVSLDGLGHGLTGKSLALKSPAVKLDGDGARVRLSGSTTLADAAQPATK